jgi:fumarate reductase subunit D
MAAERVDRVTPMLWGLFSLGGFVTAFLLPVFIVVNSLAYPFRLLPYDRVAYPGTLAWMRGDPATALLGSSLEWIGRWLPKLFVAVVVGAALFHGLHRFKYMLYDAGLHKAKRALDPIVYGIAGAGTVAAVFLAFSFP